MAVVRWSSQCLLSALAGVATSPHAMPQRTTPLDTGWEIAAAAADGARPANDAWRPARVPGSFEEQLGAQFDGVAWYRLVLDFAEGGDGRRVRLLFRAAATEATVFCNGDEVGGHLGGWTPFSIDVTAKVRRGPNLIEVRLDEKPGHNTQGFLPVIQPHFGGLWQPVTLHEDFAPTIDRERLLVFGDADTGGVTLQVALRDGPIARDVVVDVAIRDGAHRIAGARIAVDPNARRSEPLTVSVSDPRAWSPRAPNLYRAEIVVADAKTGAELDRVERRFGFRTLRRDGTTVLWNGEPLQLRGMLHWGFAPPRFAPFAKPEHWRRELEFVRGLGCNLVKCCLWVPPREFYEVADELGVVVWQEYPTWHPDLTERHRDDLRREYDEFYDHDRSHVSVAFRSLTCETGHGADVAVLRELYERAHAAIPNTLVVDDSAWISWHRVHDFYDDHPYGNNGDWRERIAALRGHIAQRTPMPLLLGECIAADTWFDLASWDRQFGAASVAGWWAPWCLDEQRRFEQRIGREYGSATLASLGAISRDHALRTRKYQIERLRLDAPDAGYVLSVIRDFPKARMGFVDDLDRAKWTERDWAWHGDTMLCLDMPDDVRTVTSGRVRFPVRVAHFGPGALDGAVRLDLDGGPEHTGARIALPAGRVGDPIVLECELTASTPRRVRLSAALEGSHSARNSWDLWLLPALRADSASDVEIVERLDDATLARLVDGAAVLLRAAPREHSIKTSNVWFLRGAPFAPPHAVHTEVPAELLIELQGFDLERNWVIDARTILDELDPILAYWDTHDIREVHTWLLACSCRVGAGRLLVSAFDAETAGGRWVEQQFVRHLATGPAPRRAWSDSTIARLRSELAAETIDLRQWQIRLDPHDVGVAAGWAAQREAAGDGDWRTIEAGRHWEAQGIDHYDGVAWYRTELAIPERWGGRGVTAVFEGVDDSYHAYLDGREIGSHGDPTTRETVWLRRTTIDLTPHVAFGRTHSLVLRVVDHAGAGGLHRPVFVTTGPVDGRPGLLH